MIRYAISYADLESRVVSHNPLWMTKAAALTEQFRKAGEFKDHAAIWRGIVRVYMQIQHNKCAFCERKFEDQSAGGAREFDVEHFRPKSSVKRWPPPRSEADLPDGFPASGGSKKGYYLLPYHLFNYTVSCKPCNQFFKSNYFPIAGRARVSGSDPRKMTGEKPYLVYPIGSFDDDPEEIIQFDGVMAVPKARRGHKKRRAQATIVFFSLNSRDEHLTERAVKISNLYLALKGEQDANPSLRRLAVASIKHLCSVGSSHTNCMRSFRRLYTVDRPRAEEVIGRIIVLLESSS